MKYMLFGIIGFYLHQTIYPIQDLEYVFDHFNSMSVEYMTQMDSVQCRNEVLENDLKLYKEEIRKTVAEAKKQKRRAIYFCKKYREEKREALKIKELLQLSYYGRTDL